jgi:hypothetical protein
MYFAYDAATDRTCCRVRDGELAEDRKKQKCGKWLIGKNCTNLKNHLRSKQKAIFEDLERLELQKKP